MTQTLAIFDLDDTLTLQDTESLWQQYLVQEGLLSEKTVSYQISLFKKHYNEGSLDIQRVVDFSLSAMLTLSHCEQQHYRQHFAKTILPHYIPQAAHDLIQRHHNQGHHTLIISAGHEFIVQPAATFFNVKDVLCTKLKRRSCGAFDSAIDGAPLFQAQKVTALKEWLAAQQHPYDITYFYSDSINDLPLLEHASIPVTVNPCDKLRDIAVQRRWPILDIKRAHFPAPQPVNPANSSA